MGRRILRPALCAAALATALFCSPALAAIPDHYQGWPCYERHACDLHRADGYTLPGGQQGFQMVIHWNLGDYYGSGDTYTYSSCSGYDPDNLGTFTFNFPEGSATNTISYIDIIRYTGANCTGGSVWENYTTGTVRILNAGAPGYETESGDLQTTLERALPTIGWGFSTSTGNGSNVTTMEDHLNLALGGATNTFPICLSYSWSGFLDKIIGITDGTAQPQTMVYTQAMGVATSSLELDLERTTLTSDPHFLEIVEKVQNYAVAVAWLAFGLFIIADLFLLKKGGEDDTI